MDPKSRYVDLPEVQIDPSVIPGSLLPLLPLARQWCIVDVEEREASIMDSTRAEVEEFVSKFNQCFAAIEDWQKELQGAIPQPDELVMFLYAADAADAADSSVIIR